MNFHINMELPAAVAAEPDFIAHARAEGWAWAVSAWQRAASTPGAVFMANEADFVVQRWPHWFQLTDDRFAGIPFHLTPWQECVVRLLFGWKRPVQIVDPRTHKPVTQMVRLFKRIDLWIPRKNGKTEFMAALSLAFFVFAGVMGGQGYAFARDEKQARVIFEKMDAMIGAKFDGRPGILARSCHVEKDNITLPKLRSVFRLLTGNAAGKHGRSPTVITGDEMHEWKSAELAQTLRQGTGARIEPMEIYASTAGVRSYEVGYDTFRRAEGVIDGTVDDPSTLAVIFAAPQEADWTDEDVWKQANPNLGLAPTIDYLRREFAEARRSRRAELAFRCYHLNQWIDETLRWLSIREWDACVRQKDWANRRERLAGRRCVLAWDLSSNRDFSVLAALFPPEGEDEHWEADFEFWLPEATADQRAEQDPRFARWRDEGAFKVTPGNMIDQQFIQDAVQAARARYDVQKIGFDKWGSEKLMTDLQNDNCPAELLIKVPMNVASLSEASKQFERLVGAGLFDHGGHPVLRFMAQNCSIRFDSNLNFMPAKKASHENIDGIMACVMGICIGLVPEEVSVYATRGVVGV